MKDLWSRIRSLPLTAHRVISFLTILGCSIIGWICSQIGDGLGFPMVLCFLGLITGIAWHCVFVRCPHCGTVLNWRAGIPKFCPECGKKL